MDPLFILGLSSLGFGLATASLVGRMAKAGQASRALGRKVFHAGIFSGAVPAQLLQGFWGVVVYGSVISLIVLVAYWQGPGLPLYDALARPCQRSRRCGSRRAEQSRDRQSLGPASSLVIGLVVSGMRENR